MALAVSLTIRKSRGRLTTRSYNVRDKLSLQACHFVRFTQITITLLPARPIDVTMAEFFLLDSAEHFDGRIAGDLALAEDDQPWQIGAGQVLEHRPGLRRREDDRRIARFDERPDGLGHGPHQAPRGVGPERRAGPRLGLARPPRAAHRPSRNATRPAAGRRRRDTAR